jgi:hypothetical protein
MRFTSMSYNLTREFEETSNIQDPEVIHPSEKTTLKHWKNRACCEKRGGFVNPLFFEARIVSISSYTIRAAHNAILIGKSFV